MIIYFKETRDIFRINLRNKGYLYEGTVTKKGTLMGFINREQKSKSEKNMLPTRRLSIIIIDLIPG